MRSFLAAYARPGLGRTIAEISREAGVDRVMYYRWIKKYGLAFEELLERTWREALRRDVGPVTSALRAKGVEGDAQAAKLVLQLGHYLQEERVLTIRDFQRILSSVVATISRHCQGCPARPSLCAELEKVL